MEGSIVGGRNGVASGWRVVEPRQGVARGRRVRALRSVRAGKPKT